MTTKRKFGSAAAIGAPIAAFVLLAGSSAVRADELADLRANQELLQKRIDQLSQAPPQAAPYVPGFGPETHKEVSGVPAVGGSFPRSFLIPGTDTSLRIGGIAWADVVWWMQGARAGGALNSQGGQPNDNEDGTGGTGLLPTSRSTTRLRIRGARRRRSRRDRAGCCSTPALRPLGARSRPISKWISARPSRLS